MFLGNCGYTSIAVSAIVSSTGISLKNQIQFKKLG